MEVKGAENFYLKSKVCKKCQCAAARKWNEANPERHLENIRKWRAANPERVRAIARQSKRNGYPQPTRSMPNGCECCGRANTKKALHLDHCHISGVFRGWLCDRCNLGVGLLGDNIDGLVRATAYLHRAYKL
jgi:hypothetical protein